MHDPSTESCKPGHPKRHPFEHFDPVIAAFDISIRIRIFEGIEDLPAPVLVCERYFDELRQAAFLRSHDPSAEPSGRLLTVPACFYKLKLLLQLICFAQRF